jgi:hypothetical protein
MACLGAALAAAHGDVGADDEALLVGKDRFFSHEISITGWRCRIK